MQMTTLGIFWTICEQPNRKAKIDRRITEYGFKEDVS